MTTNQFIT